jgi:hypothetical protein
MTRNEYYSTVEPWYSPRGFGICRVCGHDYIGDCRGNCTCLSCNAQRQYEVRKGLVFEEDEEDLEETETRGGG